MIDFDKIMDKAKVYASAASKKTGEVVEVSKLKLKEIQANSELRDAYADLGAIVYDMKKSGAVNEDLIDTCIEGIDEIRAKLDDVSDRYHAVKKTVRCDFCGAQNKAGSLFCNQCGANLAVEEARKEDEAGLEKPAALPEQHTEK